MSVAQAGPPVPSVDSVSHTLTEPTLDARQAVALLAAAVLALSVMIGVAFGPRDAANLLGARATPGTAFLQSATCADWQRWSASRRAAAVGALGVAATAPDPESAGATLDRGAAYALFARDCGSRAARTMVLYELYNRAASFSAAGPQTTPANGGFGTAPRR